MRELNPRELSVLIDERIKILFKLSKDQNDLHMSSKKAIAKQIITYIEEYEAIPREEDQ